MGVAGAQYEMANFYYEGKLIEKDKNKAISLYEKSAKRGYGQAQTKLTGLKNKGEI